MCFSQLSAFSVFASTLPLLLGAGLGLGTRLQCYGTKKQNKQKPVEGSFKRLWLRNISIVIIERGLRIFSSSLCTFLSSLLSPVHYEMKPVSCHGGDNPWPMWNIYWQWTSPQKTRKTKLLLSHFGRLPLSKDRTDNSTHWWSEKAIDGTYCTGRFDWSEYRR